MQIVLPDTPKTIALTVVRVSFGLSLLFVGLAHFADLQSFSIVVGDGLEALWFLPTVWAYIQPALMVFGGALFVIDRFRTLAAWSAGVALAIIPAGMLFKTVFGLDLADMMAAAINAWIWLIVYVLVVTLCWGDKQA